jgi:GNAT superfamily N-acetyltransferase
VLDLLIRSLEVEEREEAVGVTARGMRDNPIHVAVYGSDARTRRRGLERLFRALYAVMPEPPRVAVRRGHVIGVAGASPPGTCRLPPLALARGGLALACSGFRVARKGFAWLESWGEHDIAEPHWHVGPVAIEPGLQGLGVGSRLLADLAAQFDRLGDTAWLETDKPENVAFYARFGFEVEVEAATLGVPCWFMRRRPVDQSGSRRQDTPAPASTSRKARGSRACAVVTTPARFARPARSHCAPTAAITALAP